MAQVTETVKIQYQQGSIDLKGCYKNLSEFERQSLQQLWEKLLAQTDINIDKVTDSNNVQITPVVLNSDEKELAQEAKKAGSKVFQNCKYNETTQDIVQAQLVPVAFESTLADNTLESHLWESIREDIPDTLVLRFLRARKWNVDKALEMLLSSVKWRHLEKVEEIIYYGEILNEASLMYKGTSYIHGLDKLKYPIV
ncbi:hypothetical protein BB561_000387 [Smittium simulii]|uniref:CRAL/TRIO N-terminal domain-containing protein n=1 Tax=Smittium simulii TaxID=133385 RepID=A0A2T9YZH3_9FUNG|nr:hypothetical protein BB561_000387 [Smittium simulii]